MKAVWQTLAAAALLCGCKTAPHPTPPVPPLPPGAPKAKVVRAARVEAAVAAPTPAPTHVRFKTVNVNAIPVRVAVVVWKNVPAGLTRIYASTDLIQMRQVGAVLRLTRDDYVLDDYTVSKSDTTFYRLEVETLPNNTAGRTVIFDEWKALLVP